MDTIINELDGRVSDFKFDKQTTDAACYNKIKLDYFLMLTIAATWDLKRSAMDDIKIKSVLTYLQRPETGKLIQLIKNEWNLAPAIVKIFDTYKVGRNLRFGHNTFEEYQAIEFNSECEACWNALLDLKVFEDTDSDLIRKIYQEENSFYFIRRVDQNGDMAVLQLGSNIRRLYFSNDDMKARMLNNSNEILEGDLFLSVDDSFIKVSPFIQYNPNNNLYMMLMDIETAPLAFRMAYIYRREDTDTSQLYMEAFPKELRPYFPENARKIGGNGVALNRFSQYELFEQEYYSGIHQRIQDQLDAFITGNMAYGAVRGSAGVGKTSTVFIWMNRILKNDDGVLDKIRQKFNLRRIIFLSAKTKIYSRSVVAENLSNFYDIDSDVSNYSDIIECVYAALHSQEKPGTTFQDKADFVKNYSNSSHGILVIIDDYESLSQGARKKVQLLKDSLNPNAIKVLITTRFPSYESKDIVVEKLNETDGSNLTDIVFGDPNWRKDISPREMNQLTDGLPLLIWYAKAYYQMGQLSSKKLKSDFSGPAKGLESYLYDNFVQCFDSQFTQNFLMIATRYYKLHNTLQISKKTAIFLCLKESYEYKADDEEFYFQELMALKLITINQSSKLIDFSPLMVYMDKTKKQQEPNEQYQEDSLKLLTHLDEDRYQELNAVIESAEYLEDETKCRILNRIAEFPQKDEQVKITAIRKLFALSTEKLKLYEKNLQTFQTDPNLIKSMIAYLLEDHTIASSEYDLIRDFVYSVSVAMENLDYVEDISCKGIELVIVLLGLSLDDRESEKITNSELERRLNLLTDLAIKFLKGIADSKDILKEKIRINELLDDANVYCNNISRIE